MPSEDTSVDVSVLDELIELRRQQALIDQFCARADEMKAKVDLAVYNRVVADYASRRQALESQAAPLVTRALAEYRKLRAILSQVKSINDAAQLDKDEVEFRHSLGEIDEAARKERLVVPERVLAESAARLSTLDADEARFREALPEVDLTAEAAEPEVAAPPVPELAAEAAGAAHRTQDVDIAALAEGGSGPPSSNDVASLLGSGISMTFVPIAPDPPEGSEDNTIVSTDAVLVSESDNGQAVHFALTGSTYIGRAEDNQLRILDPGISRRHVLIAVTETGYTIRDLKSQNGTYVNGERIDEAALTDGDRITIGEMNLIFRAPVTAAAHVS